MPLSNSSFNLGALLASPAVRALAAAAEGVETHLVGGVLRDRALGLPCHDYDAVVASDGLAIARRLAETLPARLVLLGGKEFAAYRLVGAEDSIDLWDREGTALADDLERRDFTVNAFALDVATGAFHDPFGGLGDLERRTLRAVTRNSFSGDPLRVLRLPRLALKLPGFSAEPETLELARRSSGALAEVAAERVRDELALILAHDEAARGLVILHTLDLYPGLWLEAPGEPGPMGGAPAEIEALPACAAVLRRIPEPGPSAGPANEPRGTPEIDLRLARLAATFRHLGGGAPATSRLERFRDAGYLSPREAQAVRALLAESRLPEERVEQRRSFHRLGALWATAAVSLAARDTAAGDPEGARRRLDELARRAALEAAEVIAPPRLVTGHEIQELFGIAPGPRVGELLRAVLEAQVEGTVASREQALALVRARAARR